MFLKHFKSSIYVRTVLFIQKINKRNHFKNSHHKTINVSSILQTNIANVKMLSYVFNVVRRSPIGHIYIIWRRVPYSEVPNTPFCSNCNKHSTNNNYVHPKVSKKGINKYMILIFKLFFSINY